MPRKKQPIVKIHIDGNRTTNEWKLTIDEEDTYNQYSANTAYKFAYNLTCRFQEKGYKTICTQTITD